MVNASHMQSEMNRLQNSEDISAIFGKLVSGRAGYKAVIEVSHPAPKCPNPNCGKILEGNEKFCPDCGTPTNFVKK